MQGNKPVLELKNTEEKVYQKLKWKKNICQCALLYIAVLVNDLQFVIIVHCIVISCSATPWQVWINNLKFMIVHFNCIVIGCSAVPWRVHQGEDGLQVSKKSFCWKFNPENKTLMIILQIWTQSWLLRLYVWHLYMEGLGYFLKQNGRAGIFSKTKQVSCHWVARNR